MRPFFLLLFIAILQMVSSNYSHKLNTMGNGVPSIGSLARRLNYIRVASMERALRNAREGNKIWCKGRDAVVVQKVMDKSQKANLALRTSEKNNYPILLVFRPDFGVALSGEYPDMPRSTRLEFGPKPGATLGYLFISEALKQKLKIMRTEDGGFEK